MVSDWSHYGKLCYQACFVKLYNEILSHHLDSSRQSDAERIKSITRDKFCDSDVTHGHMPSHVHESLHRTKSLDFK